MNRPHAASFLQEPLSLHAPPLTAALLYITGKLKIP